MTIHLPRPHSEQLEILNNADRYNVVCCGRRWGKSKIGQSLAIKPALEGYPVGWYSPGYKSLLEVWRELKRTLLPVTVRASEVDHRIELVTGGVIEMWSLTDDPDISRGRKYKRVIFDEAAMMSKLMTAWSDTIRATLTDYAGDAWFFSTPKGRNGFWELWRRGDPTNPDRRNGWISWRKPTEGNPHLIPSEIVALREEVGDRAAAQEVDAQFLEYSGRFFEDWDEDMMTCPVKDIPSHWERIAGFDFGTRAPFAFYLGAVDETGCVWITDEIYQPGLLPFEQARLIKSLVNARGCPDVMIAADPSIFPPDDAEKRLGEYPVEAFWAAGLQFVKANNDRKGSTGGWAMVKSYMRRSKLIIFKGACSNLIRTIPLMVWDERPGHDETDMDTTLEDHACFVAGTLIETEFGAVPIELIKQGDLVHTRNGLRSVVISTMTAQNAPVMSLNLSDGSSLTGTYNHPVYTLNRGFVKLSEICYNDTLCHKSSIKYSRAIVTTRHDSARVYALDIQDIGETADVYNLSVDADHEYFANGILVSNCDSLRYLVMTRPEPVTKSTKSDWSGQTRNLSTGALADSRVVTVGSAKTIASPSALPQGALDKYDRPAGF